MSFALTGIGLITPLGRGPATHRRALLKPPPAATPLAELFGADHPLADQPCRPLPPAVRARLGKGVLAPASNLAVFLARDALADSGRRDDELAGPRTGLFLASSRGNLAGWLDPWPPRRARGPLAASNSSHAELTSAVQRELKLEGPVHLSADGCAAGLSALGLAHLHLKAGEIDRALVIAVDLPLVPTVLEAYAKSGILGSGSDDPFGEHTDGMVPAEGGAALLIERDPPGGAEFHPTLENALVRHEAHHLLHSDPGAKALSGWLDQLLPSPPEQLSGISVNPHASGTASNRNTEEALIESFSRRCPAKTLELQCFRPWTGHAIGATGLIDLALDLHLLRNGISITTPPPSGANQSGTEDQSGQQPGLVSDHQVDGERRGSAPHLHWSIGIGGQFAACLVVPPKQPARPGARLRFSVSKREMVVTTADGEPLATLPCTSAAKGIGFAEGSHQTPTGRFRVVEKYGHAAGERTVFVSRRPTVAWPDEDAQGTKVTHGILRLAGLDPANANTWDRYIYIHGTNQFAYPPENRSHGCLTLAEQDFRTLFRLVPEDAELVVVE